MLAGTAVELECARMGQSLSCFVLDFYPIIGTVRHTLFFA
jgi:hypothetical protein